MHECERFGGTVMMMPLPTYEPDKKITGGMRVVLVNGSVSVARCDKCDENTELPVIPDLPGLIAAVCVTRAKDPLKLSANEIRFMRKAMEMPAKDLAEILDVSQETISRWESKTNAQPIGGANEKIFRWLACKMLSEKAPGIAWDTNEILRLPIQARMGKSELVMHFQRVAVKTDQTAPKRAWLEEERIAA